MKSLLLDYNKLLKVLLSLQFLCVTSLMAQKLDFDSLYQNNETYRETIASIIDTVDIFTQDKIIKIILESDFKNLLKNKFKDEYQQAFIRYQVSDSVMLNCPINIKPRGNVRKQVCYFPPLKLSFPDKEAVIQQFNEFDELKMVVKCSKAKINEQYLLAEYFAYKLFNILTDYSFRVKLMEVTYVDTSKKYKPSTSYAFLIESIDQLAERQNAIPFEYSKLGEQFTNRRNLAIVYLYQFLIGNTDWSIPAGHNINMVRSKEPEDSLPYVVPFDFDYAGIVDASYAVPDVSLNIESVRERVYRGLCIDENDIIQAVDHFIRLKDKIYQLYNGSQLLDNYVLKSTIDYIDEFYRIIENDIYLHSTIVENCR